MSLAPKRKRPRSGIDRGGPLRSAKHRRFIRGFLCESCGGGERTEAAHLRIGTDGSMGDKPSDAWTTPLCPDCHTKQHNGERTFWRSLGRDPWKLCRAYALKSPDDAVVEFARTKMETEQCL